METQGVLSRIPHAREKDCNHVRGGAVASRRRSAAVLCLRLHEGPGNPRIGTAVDRKTFRTGGQPLKGADAQPIWNQPPPWSISSKENQRPLPLAFNYRPNIESLQIPAHTLQETRRTSRGRHGWPVASSSSPASQMRLRICPRHHLLLSAETVRSPAAT